MLSSCVAWCEYEDFEQSDSVIDSVYEKKLETVLRWWRRVQDPADVIARPATPVPAAPPLPLAAIPLPDGMLAPLAVHPVGGGPGGAPGGVPHGLLVRWVRVPEGDVSVCVSGVSECV